MQTLKRSIAALGVMLVFVALLSPTRHVVAQSTLTVFNAINGYLLNGTPIVLAGTPTLGAGWAATPSVTSNNGLMTMRVNVGAANTATTGSILLSPPSPTGWNCLAIDTSSNIVTRQTATATTSVTLTAASLWATGDILAIHCDPF